MTMDRHGERVPRSERCRMRSRDRWRVWIWSFVGAALSLAAVPLAIAQEEGRSAGPISAEESDVAAPDSLKPLPDSLDAGSSATDADSLRAKAMIDSLMRAADSPGVSEAVDSGPRSMDDFQDPFADPFQTDSTASNWDSVFAAYDRELPNRTFEPLVGVRYTKAEGAHLEGGVEYGPNQGRALRIAIRGGYDLGRERPIGSARLQVGDLERWRWFFMTEVHDGARVFGSHRPFGNTIFALVGGYDAQSYLRERGFSGEVNWSPIPTWRSTAGFSHRAHSSLPVSSDFHIFGSDRWMELNEAAERVDLNTVFLGIERRPRYSRDVVRPGLYLRGSGELTGGNGLRGDREFSRVELEGRYLWRLNEDRDELYIYADGGFAPGRPPTQELFDVGGAGGLRAFEPRSFIGTSRYLLRTQLAWEDRVVRRSGVPLVEKLRFHLVPFAEVGSAWGTFVPQSDWMLPKAREVHWDLGVGIRRVVESSGVLSFVQVDFAWPMGADTGPARITVQLSRRGFDP